MEEVKTNLSILLLTASTSRLFIGIRLISFIDIGEKIDWPSAAYAARWNMISTPLTRGFTCCLLMRSALTNLQSGLTFSFFPPRRLSALTTSCPDSMSLSTNQEPMNPAPPVTNTFLDSKIVLPLQYLIFEFIPKPVAALKILSMSTECFRSLRLKELFSVKETPLGTVLA